jgi:hypothetical protein
MVDNLSTDGGVAMLEEIRPEFAFQPAVIAIVHAAGKDDRAAIYRAMTLKYLVRS